MAKKKILFVATVDMHIESFHLGCLKMLKEKGYEVHVATDTDKKIPNCDKKIKIPIKRSPYSLSNLKAIKELKKVIKAEKYDIVHCHTPMGAVVARMAAKSSRKNGTKVYYTAHGFHFYKGAPKLNWMLFYPAEKYLAKFTDRLILINQEDYKLAKQRFSKRCKDIKYIPGVGIDETKFKKLSTAEVTKLKKSLGITGNKKVLLCAGRLDKNKNQGFLIDVLRRLNAKKKEYKLVLAGLDELNGKYQECAKDIKGDVIFAGHRNDMPALFAISDIVVSASKREGLPVNIIEAAMSGLPIVMTNCRGASDIKKYYNNLTIVESSVEDFAEAVKSTKKLKVDGKIKFFSSKNIEKQMERLYE